MRGYPRGPLSKQDYENLLSMPEHAERAKKELEKLASIDDSIATIETGTTEKSSIEVIDNPAPRWKQLGFKSKDDVMSLFSKYTQTSPDK